MKTINMRSGFTMIELVFVIVIIGILSAVALPKFLETSYQAHDAAVKSFLGTLNRTVGPTLWAKSIGGNSNGKILSDCINLENYTEIPDELDLVAASCTFTIKADSGATLAISNFTDGSATSSPIWDF